MEQEGRERRRTVGIEAVEDLGWIKRRFTESRMVCVGVAMNWE